MVSGTSQITLSINRIACFYKVNGARLNTNLTKISSGSRVPTPKYNSTDYFRANEFRSDNNMYRNIQNDIGEALGIMDLAENAGTYIFDDLTEMKRLIERYYDPNATSVEQEVIEAAFNVKGARINETVNDTYYGSKQLISDTVGGGTPLVSFIINPNDISQKFEIDFDSGDVADTSAFDITVGEAAATAAVQAELDKAGSYLAKASAYRVGLNAQLNIAETTKNSNEDAISNLTDVDDAKEYTQSIKRSISQQSSIAMLAQANMMKQSILALFL